LSQEVKLQPTRGSFRLRGVVAGLSNEKAYGEGVIGKGKFKGKKYRSLRFGIKTNATNTIYIELFGMEQDEITVYRREDREKNIKEDKQKLAFAKRHTPPAGYEIIETTFELEKDDAKQNVQRRLVKYDAVLYIKKYLKDGDSVYASGQTEFSEYTNPKTKVTKLQARFNIQMVSLLDTPLDYNDEKFVELSSFKQQIVFLESEVSEGRVYVMARTIQYGDKFTDVQFVVDPHGDEDIEKTATAFTSHVQYGDLVDITGNLVNRVELEEAEEFVSTGIFGSKKANGFGKRPIRRFVNEYQIVGADEETYEVGKYTEDDFAIKEFVNTDSEGENNPFMNDDDLPF
jgi:hypothetical protein